MLEISQELMTPQEAARWFRRSVSWLRQQSDLLRVGVPGGQPLFHTRVCRAFVYGKLAGLDGERLRGVQLQALASSCGLLAAQALTCDQSDELPAGSPALA